MKPRKKPVPAPVQKSQRWLRGPFKRHPRPWSLMERLVAAALVLAGLALLAGCAPWGVRQVKVPVPVPCLSQPPALTAVPLASTSRAEAAALGQSGNWAILADRAAASLRILAADRARLKAAVDGCAELPPAEVPGPPRARPPAP